MDTEQTPAAHLQALDGTGDIVPEPDWTSLLNDDLEIEAAKEYWRLITTEMRTKGTLSPVNRHALQRLVCVWLMHDRMYRVVAEDDVVIRPKRSNKRGILRISPYFTAMRECKADAIALEAELGLSPRRRDEVSKVEQKSTRQRAADAYIHGPRRK